MRKGSHLWQITILCSFAVAHLNKLNKSPIIQKMSTIYELLIFFGSQYFGSNLIIFALIIFFPNIFSTIVQEMMTSTVYASNVCLT